MKEGLSFMITKEESKKIAEDYVRENKISFDVGDMFQYDKLHQSQLNIYLTKDLNISDCWCSYVEKVNVHLDLGLHSSKIILISKATGLVVYCGSENDEG